MSSTVSTVLSRSFSVFNQLREQVTIIFSPKSINLPIIVVLVRFRLSICSWYGKLVVLYYIS